MNKAKLEVVRINEDVITTSAAGFGFIYHKPGDIYEFIWYLNGSTNQKTSTGSNTDYQGYVTVNVIYDCDANGNIIAECTHGQTELEKYVAHGINPEQ